MVSRLCLLKVSFLSYTCNTNLFSIWEKKITQTGEMGRYGSGETTSCALRGEVARKIRAFILKSKIAGLISSQGSKLKLRIDKICGLLLIYLLG